MQKEKVKIPPYDFHPTKIVKTEEVGNLMEIRLSILDKLESKQTNLTSNLFPTFLGTKEDSLGWLKSPHNDIISHYFLCLAYSKLFMSRLIIYKIDHEEALRFLKFPLEIEDNLSLEIKEKIRFKKDRIFSKKIVNNEINPESDIIYKIPFENALKLIESMNYFLYKGYVYVFKGDLSLLIETVFKENVLKRLNNMNKYYENITSDQRVADLIRSVLAKKEFESERKSYEEINNESFSIQDIELYVNKSFPLCMQTIHKNLTSSGHLKHNGRLQYGLFLKGVGLSLEESLNFWKKKFSKTTPEDKFEKEYAYNIRHNYGAEGKRTDYPPWKCEKIQKLPPPAMGETHGCPFKNFNEEYLKKILVEQNFKELDILKILEKKRTNEYSISCMRYYEAKHNQDSNYENVGIHPNSYFLSSTKYFNSKKEYKPKPRISYENPNIQITENVSNKPVQENKMDVD